MKMKFDYAHYEVAATKALVIIAFDEGRKCEGLLTDSRLGADAGEMWFAMLDAAQDVPEGQAEGAALKVGMSWMREWRGGEGGQQ